jgi:hypothetical protein
VRKSKVKTLYTEKHTFQVGDLVRVNHTKDATSTIFQVTDLWAREEREWTPVTGYGGGRQKRQKRRNSVPEAKVKPVFCYETDVTKKRTRQRIVPLRRCKPLDLVELGLAYSRFGDFLRRYANGK